MPSRTKSALLQNPNMLDVAFPFCLVDNIVINIVDDAQAFLRYDPAPTRYHTCTTTSAQASCAVVPFGRRHCARASAAISWLLLPLVHAGSNWSAACATRPTSCVNCSVRATKSVSLLISTMAATPAPCQAIKSLRIRDGRGKMHAAGKHGLLAVPLRR